DSFYIHIKVLWDMVHEHSVPIVPKISTLKEFSNRFKSAKEIKKMAQSDTSVPLIPQSKVLELKGVQPGQKKHPDKMLSDHKFTKKYWEKCTASYNLSHKISKEDDGSESDDDES
ncbi:hypothetical protein O181_116547, partial [Austropuccinia psidii MF-1]|nr:hypothetical protein [Austropuccinia psidii MF-1]